MADVLQGVIALAMTITLVAVFLTVAVFAIVVAFNVVLKLIGHDKGKMGW